LPAFFAASPRPRGEPEAAAVAATRVAKCEEPPPHAMASYATLHRTRPRGHRASRPGRMTHRDAHGRFTRRRARPASSRSRSHRASHASRSRTLSRRLRSRRSRAFQPRDAHGRFVRRPAPLEAPALVLPVGHLPPPIEHREIVKRRWWRVDGPQDPALPKGYAYRRE
jgi:hypothetical protein